MCLSDVIHLQVPTLNVLPEQLPEAFESSADLLGARVRTAPAFLQARVSTLATGDDANAKERFDKLAEDAAAAPGPLGPGLSPEEWFDAVVVGYLAQAWQQHANAVDTGTASVAAVRHLPGAL